MKQVLPALLTSRYSMFSIICSRRLGRTEICTTMMTSKGWTVASLVLMASLVVALAGVATLVAYIATLQPSTKGLAKRIRVCDRRCTQCYNCLERYAGVDNLRSSGEGGISAGVDNLRSFGEGGVSAGVDNLALLWWFLE